MTVMYTWQQQIMNFNRFHKQKMKLKTKFLPVKSSYHFSMLTVIITGYIPCLWSPHSDNGIFALF